MSASTATPLDQARYAAAEDACAPYDFDECGMWSTSSDDIWSRTIHLHPPGRASMELALKVMFSPGSADVLAVCCLATHNQVWGDTLGSPDAVETLVAKVGATAPSAYVYDESFEDGKYRIVQHRNGRMEAFRNGLPWNDLTGNKLVGAMVAEVERLRQVERELNQEVARLRAHEQLEPSTEAAADAPRAGG